MHTPTNTNTDISFSQRYNKNIHRSVYYARSNTHNEYAMLAILCRQLHIGEWHMKVCAVKGYQYAIKVIDTQLGVPLATNSSW